MVLRARRTYQRPVCARAYVWLMRFDAIRNWPLCAVDGGERDSQNVCVHSAQQSTQSERNIFSSITFCGIFSVCPCARRPNGKRNAPNLLAAAHGQCEARRYDMDLVTNGRTSKTETNMEPSIERMIKRSTHTYTIVPHRCTQYCAHSARLILPNRWLSA